MGTIEYKVMCSFLSLPPNAETNPPVWPTTCPDGEGGGPFPALCLQQSEERPLCAQLHLGGRESHLVARTFFLPCFT